MVQPVVRIDICRTFKHFTIGAWYTLTDTSHFQDPRNRGYNDKGVFISFPLSAFMNKPISGRYRYALIPWSRDPGRVKPHCPLKILSWRCASEILVDHTDYFFSHRLQYKMVSSG
ncbi:MAG: YjbH domain-containing protein [Deltaproteobacteria bacterium]|nr:YjbH domain-containing protein [Deltaproteobacteria bacterium]